MMIYVIAWGLVSVIPILGLCFFLAFAFGFLDPAFLPLGVDIDGWWLIGLVAAMFAVAPLFVWHAVRNQRLSNGSRLVWCLLLIFGNSLMFPLYWWKHIVRRF